jgi:cytochrome c-type biogenesis protein CcmH
VPIEDRDFADADQEARYHRLIAELRCPMCLNSNLAGSDAQIAQSLRAEIFDQLQEGRSDAEILEFMKARYGDFISYRPPLNAGTVVLWFGPLALLLAGIVVLRRMLVATRAAANETALDADEQRRLGAFLDERKD